MSSPPQSFRDSSPAGAPGRRRSRFTHRNLTQLATFTPSCPLRVIAHIDLDAFYAQCEMVRLNIPKDQPLAVQQWEGLIAVNYPARDAGVTRFLPLPDAKKVCPDLICQHVPVYREGDDRWAYREEGDMDISNSKVSLDPYRMESRKILKVIKEALPAELQKVEKASIDEVFMDLSAHVHSILLERFPELAGPPPYDDPQEQLPLPSISALNWKADALVDLDDAESEIDDPDWDDVAILIGSEIVRDVRRTIREKLDYTTSGGVACNKMLSKLGSGHKKPNQQTVIRNRAIQSFLGGFKFTKIRNLGGKLGDEVSQMFGTEELKDLLPISMQVLKKKLGDDSGTWFYNTIRGIDFSEVNSRTQIKSMLSAKSFRPSINSFDQGVKWLRIFVCDIFSRLVEEGVLENKRRPKTINLHHRHGGTTKSRQSPIPGGKAIDEEMLLGLAKNLFSQIVLEGRVWPCANLSLSVAGFEDGITGNMGIGAFLVKGDEAQAMRSRSGDATPEEGPTEKKRRVGANNIDKFFAASAPAAAIQPETSRSSVVREGESGEAEADAGATANGNSHLQDINAGVRRQENTDQPTLRQASISRYVCMRCDKSFDDEEALQSHQDWHFAKDLQDEERGNHTFASHKPNRPASTARHTKRGGRGKAAEAGQSKLHFG